MLGFVGGDVVPMAQHTQDLTYTLPHKHTHTRLLLDRIHFARAPNVYSLSYYYHCMPSAMERIITIIVCVFTVRRGCAPVYVWGSVVMPT